MSATNPLEFALPNGYSNTAVNPHKGGTTRMFPTVWGDHRRSISQDRTLQIQKTEISSKQ